MNIVLKKVALSFAAVLFPVLALSQINVISNVVKDNEAIQDVIKDSVNTPVAKPTVEPKAQSTEGKEYTANTITVKTSGTDKFVCNPDGVLNNSTVTWINERMQQLEDSTSVQVLVVAVKSVSSCDLQTFAVDLGNKYGVGQKETNNGLVIVLSTSCRDVVFSTGTGLEANMTDIACKNIQEKFMIPYFSKDDWNTGLENGVEAVYQYLIGNEEFKAMANEDDWGGADDIIIWGTVFGILGLSVYYANTKRTRKCPVCGATMKETKTTRRYNLETDKRRFYDVTYKCGKCGHTLTQTESYSDSSSGDSHHSGGRLGGGGRIGRSFGGGHFGGGGSHSRF